MVVVLPRRLKIEQNEQQSLQKGRGLAQAS